MISCSSGRVAEALLPMASRASRAAEQKRSATAAEVPSSGALPMTASTAVETAIEAVLPRFFALSAVRRLLADLAILSAESNVAVNVPSPRWKPIRFSIAPASTQRCAHQGDFSADGA